MMKRSELPAYIGPCYHPWRPRGRQSIAPFVPTQLTAPAPSMYAPSNNTPFLPEHKGLTTVARDYISSCYHPWRPRGNQFIAPYLPTRLIAPPLSVYAPSNNTPFRPEYKGLTTVARLY